MGDSILSSIKKMLGLADDYDAFDLDIINFINTAFMTLRQIGVGPAEGFSITGDFETWDNFTDISKIQAVKSYVYLSVKQVFDPPATSFAIEATERQTRELEWRLNFEAEGGETNG